MHTFGFRVPRTSALSRHSLVFLTAAVTGCTNMSGLGGTSDFQCKAPEGIPCQSVSGVHYNERAGNLPAQRAAMGHSAEVGEPGRPRSYLGGPADASRAAQASGEAVPAPALGAIRSDPTVIRIWLAPWEDADGDLNDESRIYLQIDSGRWLIEHNRERIRREFAPLAASTPAPRSQATPTAQGAGRPPQAAAALRPNSVPASPSGTGLGTLNQEGAR